MRGQIPAWSGSAVTQQANNTVVTTDGSGIGTIYFSSPFPSTPVVVAMGGNSESITTSSVSAGPSAAGFQFYAYSQAGALLANTVVRVLWIATLPG